MVDEDTIVDTGNSNSALIDVLRDLLDELRDDE